LNRITTACLAVACGALLVAAPATATAKKHEGEAPEAENHGKDHAGASDSKSGCEDRDFSRIFAAFHDRSLYTLAPDGDFEAGASGWELADGASVVDESSSILLGDALGAKSLELADGASAVSPAICVAKGFPSFRFAARGEGVVRVEVLYRAGRKAKKAGRVKGGDAWHLSRKVSLAQGRFRVKRGQTANVQLRFTASGGSVRVDDVYVDPRFRG